MTSDSATPDVAGSLLDYLRMTTGAQELAYADPPQQIVGGYDTRIFAFQLANAPAAFSGPLILRLFAEDDDPLRARWECVVQTAVAGLGYPAPRVLAVNGATDILGASFLIMKRLPGRPMLQAATFAAMLPQAVRLLRVYPRVLAQCQVRLHALDPGPLLRAIEAEELPAAGPIEAGSAGAVPPWMDSWSSWLVTLSACRSNRSALRSGGFSTTAQLIRLGQSSATATSIRSTS